ncbi:hypothetical protein PF005_g31786 [Phytophthora fragariae]|uniref:RxLR effector protein n=1 Tax=Phytophthora fragariae TaxID=53985 RepID=A0A6A3V374_9STRA|nr:hypothetical protein PF003_g17841 [Phytophthora fragariae]KAE8954845.1 hypothetical protein PF011_g31966 [Phytophthora fragariae]KAE9060437.1 hypothetical protein PF010_g30218 [Phytophthora fragariae]KAE9070687.1 hypothetical protein PF007_g26848 [Phytophthora fragariae]KAE9076400.1 hypothetical protein PF006_g28140 [Phytophthora fragariae]
MGRSLGCCLAILLGVWAAPFLFRGPHTLPHNAVRCGKALSNGNDLGSADTFARSPGVPPRD